MPVSTPTARTVAGLAVLAVLLVPMATRNALAVRAGEAHNPDYASPLELLLAPGGKRLYVLCQQSGEVRVLDPDTRAVTGAVAVGRSPRGFTLSPDGKRLYVANSWDDTLTVIDTARLAVTATWPVGAEPSSVAAGPDGKRLFVANRIGGDVAVLDASTGAIEKRIPAGRGASYLALSPAGDRLYVTHILPNLPPKRTGRENRTPPESEITVIDTARAEVAERLRLPGAAGVFHAAISADGRLGVAAGLQPKNLVPLAHLEHGWAFADTLTLFGPDTGAREPVVVPLDELERYASQPFAVALAPDKSRLYVTSGGSEIVTVIDIARLLRFVRTQAPPYTRDLSASSRYVAARIAVGRNPRGAVLSADGARLFVANRLDDTISVIGTRSGRVESTIRLAGPRTLTPVRRGEQAFYTARYSFQGQIGCSSCHIDSTFDGLAWDLEPDGFGINIVDNRNLEDVKGTEPFKWDGTNPSIPVECGPRTEKFFWRSENYGERTLTDLAVYIRSLPARPNRFRPAPGTLTARQERGRLLFERAVDNNGREIPRFNRCSHCHSGPKGTNLRAFDVGTLKATDLPVPLDTPQLTNIALTAPYLHDGSARTLEEVFTIYNRADQHGRTNDLTKEELQDLIEYLKTL